MTRLRTFETRLHKIRYECTRQIASGILIGVVIGLIIGTLLSAFNLWVPTLYEVSDINFNSCKCMQSTEKNTSSHQPQKEIPKLPRGAERLPPSIVVSESDFYLHRLWGDPNQDLPIKQKYLVTFAVGAEQKMSINAAVQKFSENFTILLFHYDGRSSEWNEFEWSNKAIHINAMKQTKWWYAKRFLHPDIVAPYDYIFIWDEDLGLQDFNAEKYIEITKKYGLEISQPAIVSSRYIIWSMTEKRDDVEVHKETDFENCTDRHQPPCAGFIEIMAPVFTRDAWRCVWHMIQNDLVHGWGLDFAFRRCVEPPHEKIGVVDSQWVEHQGIPSLANQGQTGQEKPAWLMVKERCLNEWKMFNARLENSMNAYNQKMEVNSTEKV